MELQKKRLQILRDNGIISSDIFQNMEVLLCYLDEKGLLGEEDKVSMLITHIAMALSRFDSGEAIYNVDSDLKEEVLSSANYLEAQSLWEDLLPILEKLPEAEKYYVLANFCNIINKK